MTPPPSSPASRESDPVSDAMREAVARQIRAWANRFGALRSWSSLADTLLKSGPIASELARLTAERDEAREDQQAAETQNEALHVKLRALAPHGSCACSYDQPGDVCSHHSPALAAAEAALTTLRADHAAEVARLTEALRCYADEDAWSGQPWRLQFESPGRDGHGSDTARDALAPKETTNV